MKDLSELTDEEWEARRCGRPTKSGRPCRTFSGGDFPCQMHTTELDKHYRKVWAKTFQEAFAEGMKAGRAEYIREVEQAAKDAEEAKTFRLETMDGKQIVEINGSYAYMWDTEKHGRKLEVGEKVEISGGWSGAWVGTVTRLGSSYTGDLAEIRW